MPAPEKLDIQSSRIISQKYGENPSSYIRRRIAAGYLPPQDHYELLADELIGPRTSWLDIGCGNAPFPNNSALSCELAARCKLFVGVDPDDGIRENRYLHERHQVPFESFSSPRQFDVVTARMVAEHVTQPRSFIRSLSRVVSPGGVVLLITVNWWSVTAITAYFSPLRFHQFAKRALWQTEDKDSFPTMYRMNRKSKLCTMMSAHGFQTNMVSVVPDASIFWRFPKIRNAELAFLRGTQKLGLPYPDTCLLATFTKKPH